jgi:hypothetical protein
VQAKLALMKSLATKMETTSATLTLRGEAEQRKMNAEGVHPTGG